MTSMMASHKAILFDLDGTLVDTAPDLIEATNRLRIEHHRNPLPTSTVRKVVSLGGAALTRLALDDQVSAAAHDRLLELYASLLGEKSHLFDGLAAALSALERANIPWGIVTNKERRFSEPLIGKLQLRPATLVCGDDLAERKPSPLPLLTAADNLDLEACQCCYIGDHCRDMEAAIKAGMSAYAAAYGYLDEEMNPDEWGADRIFYSSDELAQALIRIAE